MMKHHIFPVLLLSAAFPLAGCSTPPATESKPPAPAEAGTTPGKTPLYGNLGDHHFPITTKSPEAQKYFDQGFALSYGFNHAEGIRSFKQALALDPSCAMCQWAVAFALGPNINAPLAEDAAKEAYAAIEAARGLASGATDRERAYIDALAKRFSADPKAERAPLDRAYADAMREVVKKYPDDLDAATLFAQSLMDTSPWNYWNLDGSPRSYTNEVVSTLESVLKRKPDHMGAIHMYIHAIEASPHPERALPYADRLPSLAPAAGHIVHMPAHIYLRTSRYHDASTANENAIKADTAYFAGDRVPNNMMYEIGYRPHNAHFLVTSATLEGRRADALRAADEVKKQMPAEMTHDPSMGGMVQHMQLAPLFVKVRFGMWQDVLAEPAPAADMPYLSLMWHTAQGIAHAAQGHVDEAKKNLAEVTRLKDDPSFKTLAVSAINPAPPIVGIAHAVLAGEIAVAQEQAPAAIRHFAAAVKLEDGLTYTEPPDWPIPVRQLQGAAMLALGRYKEAEAAFRGDLKKFPDNGWSLSGIAEALDKQGKTADAAAAKAKLTEMWKAADVEVVAGRAK